MMKKKKIVIICCFTSLSYAQLPEPSQAEHSEKSCSIVQEALAEDDFFFDQDNQDWPPQEASCDDKTTMLSRLQELISVVGVQAILGALYVCDVCTCSYEWFKERLDSLTPKKA